MARVSKVEGIPQLERKLDRLGETAQDMRRPNETIAKRLEAGIAGRTRRRTGRLASSWKAKATPRSATVTNDQPYAGVQEVGWPARGIEGTHAIAETVESQRIAIVDDYDAEVSRQIRSIGGQP